MEGLVSGLVAAAVYSPSPAGGYGRKFLDVHMQQLPRPAPVHTEPNRAWEGF